MLEIDGLRAGYGEVQILRDVSLKVEAGEMVTLVGSNGAGKSTLLNALVGEKLAIISPKPQTTRNRIQGVVHVPKRQGKGGGQIVLVDTPAMKGNDTTLPPAASTSRVTATPAAGRPSEVSRTCVVIALTG